MNLNNILVHKNKICITYCIYVRCLVKLGQVIGGVFQMASINETFIDRSVHSIRINDQLVKVAKNTGIPLSGVVESCLTHYACLDDEHKIRFLIENDPDKVDEKKINEPEFNYADEAISKAKEELGNKNTKRTSNKLLIALGLTLILAFFFRKKE